MSAEATVVRNYIDWLVKVPWKKRTKILKDIAKGRTRPWMRTTSGLEKGQGTHRRVSRRAASRRETRAGPSWCLVGPPGCRQDLPSARALRGPRTASSCACPWDGVRDEADDPRPSAHLTSAPCRAKIVQNMAKAGVHNPLFLLDEVDKMSMDFRGDPSSALLGSTGPGAERDVQRSLPGGRPGPLRGDVRGVRPTP